MSNRNRKKEYAARRERVIKPRRFIPDVHGMNEAFFDVTQDAIEKGLFIEQLGDTIDYGFDSAKTLQRMLDIRDQGHGDFIIANHEYKHFRGFRNKKRYGDYRVMYRDDQITARDQIEAVSGLSDRFLDAVEGMKFWKRIDSKIFIVHASYHPEMDELVSAGLGTDNLLIARAIYGQTNGESDAEGKPVRLYDWVGDVPEGTTVLVGHDIRNTHFITHYINKSGGEVYFMDTGCGKHHTEPVYMDYVDGVLSTPFDVVTLDFHR